MLGALSGCEKEKSATEPVYNPISRLDAEVLLKQWNAERKGRLKSGEKNLVLGEREWSLASYRVSELQDVSYLSVPLEGRFFILFAKQDARTSLYFCQLLPDSAYLKRKQGVLTPGDYTGYVVLFDSRLKPCEGYRVQDGYFDGFTYAVKEVNRYTKARPTMELSAEIPEVVIQGYHPSGSSIVWFNSRSEVAPVMLMEPLGGHWGYNGYTLVPLGGNGSTGTPDPKPEVADPCAKVRGASNMPGLPAKLARLLQDAKNLQHETGYLVDNRYNYTYKEGYEGDCKVEVGVNTYTVAIIHTHPAMCGNMYSPDDIKLIWDLCQGNTIEKSDFQYGLVTSTGNAYFLSVNDYDKFSAFASRWNLSGGDISGLKNYFETNYFNHDWSSSLLESKFLDFIKDAGLTMLKGDANSGNSWNALQKDGAGNVTDVPCNN